MYYSFNDGRGGFIHGTPEEMEEFRTRDLNRTDAEHRIVPYTDEEIRAMMRILKERGGY